VARPILEYIIDLAQHPDRQSAKEPALTEIEGFMMLRNLIKNEWKGKQAEMRRRFFEQLQRDYQAEESAHSLGAGSGAGSGAGVGTDTDAATRARAGTVPRGGREFSLSDGSAAPSSISVKKVTGNASSENRQVMAFFAEQAGKQTFSAAKYSKQKSSQGGGMILSDDREFTAFVRDQERRKRDVALAKSKSPEAKLMFRLTDSDI
jgi:hypothetical protein